MQELLIQEELRFLVPGGGMTKESIMEAQDYLTVEIEDGHKRIIDINHLLKRHNIKEVISFLKEYSREKEHALRNMILIDKTHRKVDQFISALFRMTMAIKTLEEGEEVVKLARIKQGAKKSCQLYKRNSSGNNWSRSGKNGSHDAKNRTAHYPSQRAA
jgi:hypothetical protein